MPKRLATPQIVIEDSVKRDAGDIKRNEYCMLVHVYRQMMTMPKEVRETFGPGIRSQLANLTGVGDTTAQKAISFSKKGEVPTFSSTSNAGRPVKVLDEDYAAKVREIAARKLPDGHTTMTALMIQKALLDDYGIKKTMQTLRRDMLKLDLRWTGDKFVQGRGKRANPKPPSNWPKRNRTKGKMRDNGDEDVAMDAVNLDEADVDMEGSADMQVHGHGHDQDQVLLAVQVADQDQVAAAVRTLEQVVGKAPEQVAADVQAEYEIAARVQALIQGQSQSQGQGQA